MLKVHVTITTETGAVLDRLTVTGNDGQSVLEIANKIGDTLEFEGNFEDVK